VNNTKSFFHDPNVASQGTPEEMFGAVASNPWRLALEGLQAGIWDWNLVTGEQTHSQRWEQQLGYSGQELTGGYDAFKARVHPDDLATMETAMAAYLEGRSSHYAIELRLRCKNGQWRWIGASGIIVSRDAQGRPTRLIGTHNDIAQRKQAEHDLIDLNADLKEKTRLLRTTLDHISQGIFLLDAGGAARHTHDTSDPDTVQRISGQPRGFWQE